MFHMPCFFFISGRLFKTRYLDDMKTGIVHKLKGIYWPFVKWELIFLLLHNLFVYCHYQSDWYTLSKTMDCALRLVLFSGGAQQLLGGFWFLSSLFWATLYSMTFLWVLKKMNKLTLRYISGGVILILLIACAKEYIPIDMPGKLSVVNLLATAFFLSGYMSQRVLSLITPSISRSLLCFLLPAILALFFHWDIGADSPVIPYFITGCMGTLGLLYLSACLSHVSSRVTKVLTYVGERTLYILIYHFLAFKLLGNVYVAINGLPLTRLLEFPILQDMPTGFWILYTIVGVEFSLMCEWVGRKIFKN
jgi:fucose 4-O-acetylase-like acetyltransferase